MNIDHAKAIPISEILTKLDIHPKRISVDKTLYSSPLRKEKTPSFWIYPKTNSWYDYGTGQGGDLVDFVRHYLKATKEDHTTADALRWIKNMALSEMILPEVQFQTNVITATEPPLSVRCEKPIEHLALIHYLTNRGVTLELGKEHLSEVTIDNNATGKSFFALGFKNEENGYELRNPFFKGSTKPKTISFIRGDQLPAKRIHIFEGFMDYLSAVTRFGQDYLEGDSIVLNSVSCLPKAYPFIQNYGYQHICSWMDNDKAGNNTGRLLSEFLKTQDDIQHIRMNQIYAPYKDVNEWHLATLGSLSV